MGVFILYIDYLGLYESRIMLTRSTMSLCINIILATLVVYKMHP